MTVKVGDLVSLKRTQYCLFGRVVGRVLTTTAVVFLEVLLLQYEPEIAVLTEDEAELAIMTFAGPRRAP